MTTNPSLDDKQCSLRERKKQRTWHAIHDAAFDLVTQRGLAHVTIADICASATISERTFFNYFPSKAAAALGLPATAIAEDDERRFLEGRGPLLDDLCELIASVSSGHDNLPRVRELIRLEPDLLAALHQWTSGLRKQVIQLAEKRTSEPVRAHLAVALVFAALFLHADSGYTNRPGKARASAADLRATVSRLGELAAE
ncbi:TetR/AcrR family transcriptional regulator [Sinomonas susongensis]|uniref:TetR/AcrR family transcriptional regulator n=1 Tax=Sinomonas susongensis TaxID=1324851 RepID=UPI001486A6C0|nr:TetR/AcrR family transcriptional regulator [Sinomonas susongensis]